MSAWFRCCWATIVLILSGLLAAPAVFAESTYSFNLPEQSLADSLRAIGQQTEINILFEPDAVKNARSPALRGQYTVDEAIRLVLAGTKLEAQHTTASNVLIKIRSARSTAQPAIGADPQGSPGTRLAQSNSSNPQSESAAGTQNTGSSNSTSEPSKNENLSEIVVTADKRSEPLKNVPASVTAVPAAELQQIGAAKLDDYAARIPGLTVVNASEAQGSTQLTLRGITTGIGGNPTVGVYIDDSPFGGSTAFGAFTVPDLDPQDLAQVEVLRGPQGTLYGAGSLGGLLKYVTAAPDPSHFFGRLETDYSSVDGGGIGYAVRGSANIPINDKMALRVSAFDRQDPGYIDNVLTGQNNVNEARFYGGRASLGWQVDQDWKVRLSALYQYQRGASPLVEYDPVTFKPIYGDLKESDAIGTNVDTQKLTALNLEIEGELGNFATLTSSTGYDEQRGNFSVDYTPLVSGLIAGVFGIPDAGLGLEDDLKVTKFTQEVRLTSPENQTVSWLLGGFYTHEQTGIVATSPVFNQFTGVPIAGLPTFFYSNNKTFFKEEAVFGDVTWHIVPAFDITGGVRYSHDSQSGPTYATGLLNNGTTDVDSNSNDSAVTWLLNPRYHLNDNTMIYARFATGYRPGGPNTGIAGTPPTFGPDKVTSYEIGTKTELFDRTVSLDFAAYWIDWNDIQVQEISAGGISYIANGSAAVSRGVEGSATWRPSAGLQLFADAAYQNAHLTEDFPAGGAIGVAGDPLPLTPLWSGALGGDYRFPLWGWGDWNGVIGADWRYVGHTQGAFANSGAVRFEHPSYNVFGLRAGVKNDRWSFTVHGKNLGDSRGQTGDLNLGTFSRVAVIQPRTIEVSLSRSF